MLYGRGQPIGVDVTPLCLLARALRTDPLWDLPVGFPTSGLTGLVPPRQRSFPFTASHPTLSCLMQLLNPAQ